jgi:hypothetical protein
MFRQSAYQQNVTVETVKQYFYVYILSPPPFETGLLAIETAVTCFNHHIVLRRMFFWRQEDL